MRSELRHLLMRHRAYEKRKRREEVHIVGLRNEVRGFAGDDPLDRDDLYGVPKSSQDTDKDAAARKELLRRVDFSDTEEMAVEDTSELTE